MTINIYSPLLVFFTDKNVFHNLGTSKIVAYDEGKLLRSKAGYIILILFRIIFVL